MNQFDFTATDSQTSNPFNFNSTNSTTPFDATNLGIATNTILGLPKATVDVGKKILQGIARSFGSVGTTAGNVPTQIANKITGGNQPLPFDQSIDTKSNPISNAIFGGEPVKTIQKTTIDVQDVLQHYIGQRGASYTALPLVLGGIAMDLSGFGGKSVVKSFSGEIPEAFFKFVAKEESPGVIEATLRRIGLDEGASKMLAPELAKTKTVQSVKDVLFNFEKPKNGLSLSLTEQEIQTLKTQGISDATIQRIQTQGIAKLKNAIQTFDYRPNQPVAPSVASAITPGRTITPNTMEVPTSVPNRVPEPTPSVPTISSPSTPQTIAEVPQTKSGLQIRQEAPPPPTNTNLPVSSSYDGNIPTPEQSVQKIIEALKVAKPIRGQQETIYSQTRSQRLAESQKVGKTTSGEQGFYSELAPLKGEIAKVQFEEIRSKLHPQDIENVFNVVKNSPKLSGFETITARTGLTKLFFEKGGRVPTVGEISLLERALGKDFVKAVIDKRGFWQKALEVVLKGVNLPRTLMASFDLSAPFRQGIFFIGRKQFWTSFDDMFKSFGSEKAFQAVQDSIAAMPTYDLMNESGLALTNVGKSLELREEQFMSEWGERIPVIGRGVAASSRAYTSFLNKVRADVFQDLVTKAQKIGRNPYEDRDLAVGLAKFINAATGRGSLGAFERAASLLNGFFFSPRLAASRLTLLNPMSYIKADPFIRKQMLSSLFSFAGIAVTVLTLSKLAGADVETRATSSDYGKIKIGKTRLDILGGFQQYIRMGAQLYTGKYISSTTGKEFTLGEGYKPVTRYDILQRQIESKEAPIFSLITAILKQQDYAGQPVKIGPEVVSRFVPMIAQDIHDIMKTDPSLLPLGIPAIFGASLQTYDPKKTTGKVAPKSGGNQFNF